ncbi:hypothetical protein [Actinomycetospora termitidis]|uniref:Uncharacterized protein n=1 Tax=Actinomycetospora termitidis TaxID=3053470 RepID=A0ABT7MB06_9PSEU|nr:hypothetical protein [Actinomycetospora sp. Odt1-22]MDL5157845.1 hypothetical protein [Actinomycetospora sp. Odt1-22]
MRVHPLRSKGVVVGVPVAAAVAFGAHSVLGVTPLSEQQDAAPAAATAAPSASPLQSYGLATPPPPATLDLLSAPGDQEPAESSTTPGTSSAGSTARGTSTTKIAAPGEAAAPTQTLPIAGAKPAPSMMTFSGGEQTAPQRQAAAPAAPQHQQSAPAPQEAEHDDTDDGGQQQSGGGGALLGLDLGVAKVSVLSFGQ